MNLPLALGMPGWPEMILLAVILILLFGAKKLPALARGVGQSLGEFKKGRAESDAEAKKTAALESPENEEKKDSL